MSERLRPGDMAFLAAESARTPMHNATLEVFEPGRDGFDYERLIGLIADRIAFVPRYRQRIRTIPGRIANPVWVDDDDFASDLESFACYLVSLGEALREARAGTGRLLHVQFQP